MKIQPASAVSTDRPMIVTIAGQQGAGKTTLGASFPRPLIVRVEDGVRSIADMQDVLVTDPVRRPEDVMQVVDDLVTGKSGVTVETVVVDSISALEPMVERSIVREAGARNLNQAYGGYGAGQAALATWFRYFRERCGALLDKGINVVYLAHVTTETVEPPDLENYTRTTLNMREKCARPYVDDVDLVGILRPVVETEEVSGRRVAVSNLRRELICATHPAHVGKNRFGITAALPVEERGNPLAQWLPKGSQGAQPTPAANEPHGEF